MEDFVESLTRGNITEVKVVLATVVIGLAAYQLFLIAVGYGKLRLPVLESRPAAGAHRTSGDAIVVLLGVVAVMCLSYFELEDAGLHAVAGAALLAALALKVAVLRRWRHLSRYLPALGITVFALLAITWASSAGSFLADR